MNKDHESVGKDEGRDDNYDYGDDVDDADDGQDLQASTAASPGKHSSLALSYPNIGILILCYHHHHNI